MKRAITARDYMATRLVTLSPDMDVMDAVAVLLEERISGAPVVDSRGNLVGILSEKDCLQIAVTAGYYGERGGPVSQFMHRNVVTVEPSTPIFEVAKLFLGSHFRRYPVVDADNRLVGQLSRRDVLRAIRDLQSSETGRS